MMSIRKEKIYFPKCQCGHPLNRSGGVWTYVDITGIYLKQAVFVLHAMKVLNKRIKINKDASMKYKELLPFFIISLIMSLNVSAKEFILMEGTFNKIKHTPIHLFKHDGAWMNEACFNNKTDCPYYSSSLPEEAPNLSPLAGHPAARYCTQVNGHSVTLNDNENNGWSFCLFKDRKYFVSSWGLYKKRNWGLHEVREGCEANDEAISFSFDTINVMLAFKVIADHAKLKEDFDPSIDFSTAMTFKCIPWKEVLQIITNKYNLIVKIDSGVLRVSKK